MFKVEKLKTSDKLIFAYVKKDLKDIKLNAIAKNHLPIHYDLTTDKDYDIYSYKLEKNECITLENTSKAFMIEAISINGKVNSIKLLKDGDVFKHANNSEINNKQLNTFNLIDIKGSFVESIITNK